MICLNGISNGSIASAWQSGLTNATTFGSGPGAISGCPPVQPYTNATSGTGRSCGFFGSNHFSSHVTTWVGDTPTNTSTALHPGENGTLAADQMFVVTLNFNRSVPKSTEYNLTVFLANATPEPVHLFVTTPSTLGAAGVKVTIAFDMSAAWFVELHSSSAIYATIGNSTTAVAYVTPCTRCYVTFSESGLPSGRTWSATVSATTQTSHTTTLSFQESTGRYTFSIGAPAWREAVPALVPHPQTSLDFVHLR